MWTGIDKSRRTLLEAVIRGTTGSTVMVAAEASAFELLTLVVRMVAAVIHISCRSCRNCFVHMLTLSLRSAYKVRCTTSAVRHLCAFHLDTSISSLVFSHRSLMQHHLPWLC